MSDEEEAPDPIAAFDQALRACVDLARGVRSYYAALIAQGFGQTEALSLTLAFQTHLLASQQ